MLTKNNICILKKSPSPPPHPPRPRDKKTYWGAGEVQKKYSRKGKLNEKNSCTPINPKKYSCYGLKKIHTRNLITKKIAIFYGQF